jgi:hypothetical protein
MLLASDMVFMAQPLNYWRNHSGTVRSSTVRNGRMIVEAYEVLSAITSLTDIDHSVLRKAQATRFHTWVCYAEDYRFGFRENLSIYRAARNFDPNINIRLLRYLPLAPIRLLGRPILNALRWRRIKAAKSI